MQTWLTFPRCFSDQSKWVLGDIQLSKEEGRHLTRVRRVGVGSSVTVLNGMGSIAMGVVKEIDRDRVTVGLEKIKILTPVQPEILLVIAGLKQSAWDDVLRHSVELGVNQLLRVQTEHSVAEVHTDKERKKRQRWREIMIEAVKQSGNAWLPELKLCNSVQEALEQIPESTIQLLAGMEGEPTPVDKVLSQDFPSSIAIWIGPEGDFSSGEREIIKQKGAKLISLGYRVLRAETAALSLLSYLRLRA